MTRWPLGSSPTARDTLYINLPTYIILQLVAAFDAYHKQSHPGCKLSTLAVLAPDDAWNMPWFLLTQG